MNSCGSCSFDLTGHDSGIRYDSKRLSCFCISQLVSGLSCDLQSGAAQLCAVQEVCKDIPPLPRILGAENHIKGGKQNPGAGNPAITARWGDNGRPPSPLSRPSLLSLPSDAHLLYFCFLLSSHHLFSVLRTFSLLPQHFPSCTPLHSLPNMSALSLAPPSLPFITSVLLTCRLLISVLCFHPSFFSASSSSSPSPCFDLLSV